jgi:hypothetical protein
VKERVVDVSSTIVILSFVSVDFIGGFDTFSAYQSPAKTSHMQLQPIYVYVSPPNQVAVWWSCDSIGRVTVM